MILISHRGNIDSKKPALENSPNYIVNYIEKGFECEVDVWYVDNKLFLGHDNPQYPLEQPLLDTYSKVLWLHCKNIDAISYFISIDRVGKKYNYFWHEKDTVTLTSKNYIWAFPGKQPIKESIAVLPEIFNEDISKVSGVCSDFIQRYI